MSVRRRRDRGSLFDNEGLLSLEETDVSIFGDTLDVDSGRQVASPISIHDILPDPAQPRRAVPSPVRVYWDGKPERIAELFATWFSLAVQERGEEFDIEPYLLAQEQAPRPVKVGPVEAALLDVVELAASIRTTGLTNPITVARAGADTYRLETGERRWLAYHILAISFEDERKLWEKIPARIVEAVDVWRQASENNARANLNAVSKARQIAILVMELYRAQGVEFAPYAQLVRPGSSDRAYYAQVADGLRYPVPKGSAEAVMNAMGFKQPSQLSEHRSLLTLPDEVWRIADDLNWAQGRIRDLRRRAGPDDDQLVKLVISQAAAAGYSFGIPKPDSPPPPVGEPVETYNPLASGENKRRFQRLWRLAGRVGEAGNIATRRDLEEIQAMRVWLDALENEVRNRLRS